VTVSFADVQGSMDLLAEPGSEERAVASPAADTGVSTHEIWETAQKKSETP